jgi:hypothetical protein
VAGVLDCTDSRERRALRGDGTVTVFAPADRADLAGASLPVIAWVHGGRYEEGHGDDGWYDGTTLARSGCIVVTLNYRKRFAGFLPLDTDDTDESDRDRRDRRAGFPRRRRSPPRPAVGAGDRRRARR